MANAHTEFHIPRHHSKHFTLKSLFHTHKNPVKYVHYLHLQMWKLIMCPNPIFFPDQPKVLPPSRSLFEVMVKLIS